jgi:hypothetical protein
LSGETLRGSYSSFLLSSFYLLLSFSSLVLCCCSCLPDTFLPDTTQLSAFQSLQKIAKKF